MTHSAVVNMTRFRGRPMCLTSVHSLCRSKVLFSYRNTAKHMSRRQATNDTLMWKWSGKNRVQAADVSMFARA